METVARRWHMARVELRDHLVELEVKRPSTVNSASSP
jgi:hypothetical protein